jgi:hypothetical protein
MLLTEQALAVTVTAVPDNVLHLPVTADHRPGVDWDDDFFGGFFSGPRQHRQRIIETRNARSTAAYRQPSGRYQSDEFFSRFCEGPRRHRATHA